MKRFGTILGSLVVAAAAAQTVGAAWTFMSPMNNTKYAQTASISFAGSGGTNGTGFMVECAKDGVMEQTVNGTCGMLGYWGGTLAPPIPSGWTVDSGAPEHSLYVWVGGARQSTSRSIEIVP
ncbi:MAG: hypothetical protein SFV23_00465 [Planctomycetaceae bacterium]|nr:hypothetical protein [Planctomycetaceae bacterium]